jgi:hypothetical protein
MDRWIFGGGGGRAEPGFFLLLRSVRISKVVLHDLPLSQSHFLEKLSLTFFFLELFVLLDIRKAEGRSPEGRSSPFSLFISYI